MDHKIINFWTNVEAILGGHFGARIGSKTEPKMGPLLEPSAPALRGPNNAKTGRMVKRLLELELYSAKEREGLALKFASIQKQVD